jgi:hypothetical protein
MCLLSSNAAFAATEPLVDERRWAVSLKTGRNFAKIRYEEAIDLLKRAIA